MERRGAALCGNVDETVDRVDVLFDIFTEFGRHGRRVIESNRAEVAGAEVQDNADGASMVQPESQGH